MLLDFLSVLLLSGATAMVTAGPVHVSPRELPSIIATSTAKTYLSELVVAAESNTPAYDRTLFKHWITISGSCDTRETVLKRDGTSVITGDDCKATSGSWISPYDGVSTISASDLDIDHLVPLKEAWVSGAKDWTNEEREAFANDLTRPQLVAVTASLNRSKGDQDISEFIPPLASFVCSYTKAWVQIKHHYELTIDSVEKQTISDILKGC